MFEKIMEGTDMCTLNLQAWYDRGKCMPHFILFCSKMGKKSMTN